MPNLDMVVLGIAFDHLAQASLEVKRTCKNRLAVVYYPNSVVGRWVTTSQWCLFILVNELMGELNNQLYLFMILEKLRLVPYFVFYGSFYVDAFIQQAK